MKLSKTLNHIIAWGLLVAIIVLIVTSLIVRDTKFILDRPWAFTVETIIFSVIPALFIAVVFLKTRAITLKTSTTWFILFMLKFAIFHILFQLSGIYSVIFSTYVGI